MHVAVQQLNRYACDFLMAIHAALLDVCCLHDIQLNSVFLIHFLVICLFSSLPFLLALYEHTDTQRRQHSAAILISHHVAILPVLIVC